MPGTVEADASTHPPTTRIPPSTAMPGTAGDALLASADADKAPKVSDPDGLEHLAGSVGFQVEATEPDRLPRLLASADATPTDISDPENLEHLAGTVGFKVEATGSNRLPRLLTAADPRTSLTICEGRDGAHSSHGDALTLPYMIKYRSQLGLSEDQQMRCLMQIAEVTIIHMDGYNCYTWKFCTGEPLMHFSVLDLVNPFPPVHSSIVQATTTWPLRTLVRYDEGTWYSQPRRDWPSLPDSVLQDILSAIDCTLDFYAFAYTCKSWCLASSLYPRPLLLHPLATPTWLFGTPGGRWNNTIGNFRLFPAKRMKEHRTLIGGSAKFLIFLENSICSIINIHTGQSKEIHVPYCGVQRGVLSAPPASSNILLVTGTSVLCKSINSSDEWRVQNFAGIHVRQIDDIVFVGEMAYLIDKRSRLFIITPDLEISFWALEDFPVHAPI